VFIGQTNNCSTFFYITDRSGKEYAYTYGSIKTSAGTWNHVAYVYEKADLRIYLNGTLSSSKIFYSSASLINSSSVNTTRNFNFLGGGLNYNYVGTKWLDEVRLYNKALSKAQVKLDMATASDIAPGIC
jgi:hypothetical protein